ncbi:MAG: ferrous iron transporter B [Gemmatimonadetes bacterium]|nr:ferrous iron transporter B [Gemmatimonadota bacterium]
MNPASESVDESSPLIGVIGNPNTGKTTLFNALTGLSQRVGNYSGVTVERKQGKLRIPDGSSLELLDLPGSYSLDGQSPDERIVKEVLQRRADGDQPLAGILIVVDAVHLKRNFNLVAQVLATGLPAALVVNMVDLAQREGVTVDAAALSAALGIDVFSVCATRRDGLDQLVDGVTRLRAPKPVDPDVDVWIDRVLSDSLVRPDGLHASRSDQVDRLLTHPVFGGITFAVVMAVVFEAIFTWTGPLMDAVEGLMGWIGDRVATIVPEGLLQSLLLNGAVAGVGSVVIFLPQIAMLFLAIAILEDCGYMPRAAMLMDRLLRRCGLSGRSFIPMLCSFACAIPGIMAARTIEDRRDRLVTILVAPLMSCSARLPVYTVFIAAFIPNESVGGLPLGLPTATMMGLYLLGIAVAIPVALLLKRCALRGDSAPFLMELPSYKMPNARTVWMRVYHACLAFLRRAGTVIFAASVIVWALATFPRTDTDDPSLALRNSLLGGSGQAIEPLVKPLGWDWRLAIATLSALPAREIVLASLGTIYSVEDPVEDAESLKSALMNAKSDDGSPAFTIPVVLSVLVFFALCAQCSSTLVVIKQEAGAWGWAVFTFIYMTGLAYVGALLVYQATRLMGW